MKKLSISNLSERELRAIEKIKEYYNSKTKAGAVRRGLIDLGKILDYQMKEFRTEKKEEI